MILLQSYVYIYIYRCFVVSHINNPGSCSYAVLLSVELDIHMYIWMQQLSHRLTKVVGANVTTVLWANCISGVRPTLSIPWHGRLRVKIWLLAVIKNPLTNPFLRHHKSDLWDIVHGMSAKIWDSRDKRCWYPPTSPETLMSLGVFYVWTCFGATFPLVGCSFTISVKEIDQKQCQKWSD